MQRLYGGATEIMEFMDAAWPEPPHRPRTRPDRDTGEEQRCHLRPSPTTAALVRSRASHGRVQNRFYHASEITSVTISRPGGLTVPDRPDRLDVQTAQYLPDDPGEPWSPAVEIAVYASGHYRLIGLTPEEARELAGMLSKAADIVSAA